MNKWLQRLDYLFVLRPTLFIPVWTIALAGHWAQLRFAPASQHLKGNVANGSEWLIILYLSLFTAVMGAIFLLNQIQDIESDRFNQKLYLIANGDVPIRHAWLETALLVTVPSLITFLLRRADLSGMMLAAFFSMGWLYSCRPFSLKDHPFGGLLINLIGGYLVFAFGWLMTSPWHDKLWWLATPYVLGMVAIYFLTTIPDRSGDAAAQKVTMAVRYGDRTALSMGFAAHLLALGAGIWTRDWVVLLALLAVSPFFIITLRTLSLKNVLTTNKYAALFLSAVVCYRFPFYLLILVVVYYVSKWYYRKRFNLIYPSLQS